MMGIETIERKDCMSVTSSFFDWARQEGWQLTLTEEPREAPQQAFQRYAPPPAAYIAFLRQVELLCNPDDNCWFLTVDDFADTASDLPWHASSFEQMSLEAAEDDPEWSGDIKAFWDKHLPIVFSVSGDYEYYAIHLEDGAVVNGYEADFEEADPVASSFEDFLQKVIEGEIILI